MKHNHSIGARIAAVLFTAVLVVGGVLTVALPDRTFSENENRFLQKTPSVSGEAILDGTFQEELDAYMNDQFPLRDMWTLIGSAFKKATGRKDIGGAYLGKDGYYFEKVTENDMDMARYRRNLRLVDEFAAQHPDQAVDVMLIPSAGTVLADKLPDFAPLYDADALYTQAAQTLKNSTLRDLRGALTEAAAAEQVYYKTDHHWTTAGAAVAYSALTGKEAPALTTVSEDFYGTLYSKTLDAAATPDSVQLAPIADTVQATADGKPCDVYVRENLQVKDQYTVFFGGNHGLVTMTGGCDNSKTLLVIKDSFANCLAPMLTADYETVLMVDLRFYVESVSALTAAYEVDDVLFLYEMSSFAGDRNLTRLAIEG